MESNKKFERCIDACYTCAVVCEQCISECLMESDVIRLANCIKLDRESAAICRATAELMSLGSHHSGLLCHLCAESCVACAEECEKFADLMEHCRRCAEECRRCAQICREMVEEMPRIINH